MKSEPRGKELIYKYKENYHISKDEAITEEMILKHWELEKNLTRQLLNSNSENRWTIFEECYSNLYNEVKWLNKTENQLDKSIFFKNWVNLIGHSPQKVYEIGSGKGELISYLASSGYKCKATEITKERGERNTLNPNLSWGNSDGIHLDKFEEIDQYNVVISNQVIEHLHPDDLYEHFKGVFSILSSGGRYIFTTPHKFVGPCDISRVFNCDKPEGMHLKEYTFKEIETALLKSGFVDVQAIIMLPSYLYQKLGIHYIRPKKSTVYLRYLCSLEKLICFFKKENPTNISQKLLMLMFFSPVIFIIAKKK